MALAFFVVVPARAQGGAAALPMEEFLPLAKNERARLLGGQVLVKTLASNSSREVAVAGVAWLNLPPEFFLAQYRDIAAFKRSPQVAQIGSFGQPPGSGDMKNLAWEAADIEALKRCRAGNCGVKLSSDAMRRLRGQVDWHRPNYQTLVQSVMRDLLAEYLARYMTVGNSALMRYDDKNPPMLLSEEFRSILEGSRCVRYLAPELNDHLLGYPGLRPPGSESFFYWSKESFGLKPVVSVTHVVIHRKARNGRDWFMIASKQLYASHYFEGSLGLTVLIGDGGTSGGRGCWIVYMNRSRADGLGGWLASVKRAVVVRRLSSGMMQEIQRIRSRLESAYRGRAASK